MKMPIPKDWDGTTFCRWAVCWPDSVMWKAILWGLISTPSQGRFWDEQTGRIIDTQASFRPAYLANFNLGEVIMACNDSGIAEALNAIALAMSQQNSAATNISLSCGGGGGEVSNTTYCYGGGDVNIQLTVPITGGIDWPVYGTQPPAVVPETGFPEGYEDMEDYLDDKCRKANKIVSDWIATLRNIGNVQNWTGAVGATLIIACIVGIIAVPPAVIPLLLFALATSIGINAVIIALANKLEENYEDVVCVLYEGENTSMVISGLADLLDIMIADIPVTGILAITLKSIALWLVSSNTMNYLFSASAKGQFPDADCSGCNDECGYIWNWQGENLAGWDFSGVFECTTAVQIATDPDFSRLVASPTGAPFGYFYSTSDLPQAFIVTATSSLEFQLNTGTTTTLYIVAQIASEPGVWKYLNGSGTWPAGSQPLGAILTDIMGEEITHVGLYAAWTVPGDKFIDLDTLTWVC